MRKALKQVIAVGCLIATCATEGGVAKAFPTTAPLWGPSGLGTIPTTDTVPADTFELGADYERIRPDSGHVSYSPTLTATIGLHRGEIGVAAVRERVSDTGFSDTNRLFAAHGKYRFLENRRSGAALAIGGHYLNLDNGDGHVNSLYLVGSYPLLMRESGLILRGHLGALYQCISTIENRSEIRPIAGLELRSGQDVSFAADYAPRNGNAPRSASLVARYQNPRGLGAQIGIGHIQSDTKYFVGISYRFSHKSR